MIEAIVFFLRALLAAVFVAAGSAKLADPKSFVMTLKGLRVPIRQERLIDGLALVVPFVEVVVGIALVSDLWPAVTSIVALVLMGSFSLVVFVALQRTPYVTCRCFGALSDSQFNNKGLVRSLLLTAVAGFVLWFESTYMLQFDEPVSAVLLLVAGYLVFAIATFQAAKTIAAVKERIAI